MRPIYTVGLIVACLGAALVTFGNWVSMQQNRVTEWEHGYRTPRVEIARCRSALFGEGLQIRFSQAPMQSDDPRIVNFVTLHGGTVLQMGGAPGTPVLVLVPGVTDRRTADAWIQLNITGLDDLARQL